MIKEHDIKTNKMRYFIINLYLFFLIYVIDAKLKIADITQHSIIKSEKIVKKENSKGISQSYELNADNTLNEATIVGYKIVSKKVMKEKNGWRTMVLLEYKLS